MVIHLAIEDLVRIKQPMRPPITPALVCLALTLPLSAGTIIRANSPGANGMGAQNTSIPNTFGDHIALATPGNTSFETNLGVDSLPGTPGIGLTWSATAGIASNRWEFHTWAGATPANTGGGALQMDGSSPNSTFSVTFTPAAATRLILNSFNFVGDTNNDTYQYRVDIVDASSGTIEQTTTTNPWTTNTSQTPQSNGTFAGAPAINLNFTGNTGTPYRLDITRIGGTGSALNIAIDNLDFAQTPTPGTPDALVGLWDFDDPSNLGKATVGPDLTIQGTPPIQTAEMTDAQSVPTTLQGVITTTQGTANHLVATHSIGPNGGGTRVNRYTLVFDVRIPSPGQWRSFYQTTIANNNDAEYFVRSTNNTLGRTSIAYSSTPVLSDRWHRIAIAVDLSPGGSFRTYLDGQPYFTHTLPALNGDFSLDPSQILLFGDNDGENHPLSIGMAAIFAKTLSASEASALGSAGLPVISNPGNTAPSLTIAPAGPETSSTGTTETFSFQATDAENDTVQIQADWGDGNLSLWTTLAASGETLTRTHTWTAPGSYLIRARARDAQGSISPWTIIQSIQITGPPIVTFLTPPYLQNMASDRIAVMWETAEDLQLDLTFGLPGLTSSPVAGERVPSGGGTFLHRALIGGLTPGTTYHYQITGNGESITPTASFRTAPAVWEDFKFGALGDTQTTNGNTWQADPWEPAKIMLDHMASRGTSFGLAVGDLAQDGNTYPNTRNSFLNRWAAVYGPHRPFYIAWGNHDGSSPSHPLRLSADLPSRWQTSESPSTRTPGYGNYTFSHAGVFFVCLEYFETNNKSNTDPTNDITNGWLDTVLSSPAATHARFRILSVHVPPYCERWINGNANLRSQLVPRLERYNVDLCLSGHMHGYERGRINDVQYVITGTGSYLDFSEPLVADWSATTDDGLWLGGHHSVPGLYATQSSNRILGTPQPISGGLFHGYSEITVRDRYLRLDQHAFNADGSYIGILDTLEIGGSDPGPDTDGDGMRDIWEIANQLDPNNPLDASADPDADGQNNLSEHLAGTDPRSRTSVFTVLSHTLAKGEISLTWSSNLGRRYLIAHSTDLTNWQPVLSSPGVPHIIHASPGATTTATLTAPDSTAGFFRVEIVR